MRLATGAKRSARVLMTSEDPGDATAANGSERSPISAGVGAAHFFPTATETAGQFSII